MDIFLLLISFQGANGVLNIFIIPLTLVVGLRGPDRTKSA